MTGLFSCLVGVLRVTTRTMLSSRGWAAMTQADIQLSGGKFFFLINTRSPTFMLRSLWIHLGRCWIWCKYSLLHVFQNECCACWTSCQRESQLVGIEVKSGCGRATKGSSIRKCPGFNMLNSLGSGDNLHKGRVFKIASTLVKKVVNSSKVRTWFPRLRFGWYLVP